LGVRSRGWQTLRCAEVCPACALPVQESAGVAIPVVAFFTSEGIVMINSEGQRHGYFSEKELSQTLELSRQQFTDARRKEYQITDDRILESLARINESNDYAKVVWRAQQDNASEEQFFDVEYLAGALTSLKMFYSLEVIDGRNLHSLSKTLDVFWHAHQDFTFDYTRFCNKAFGHGQFLHHLPLDKRSEVQQGIITRRYNYTRTILGKIYTIDRKFWGEGVPICCSYEATSADDFVFWQPALMAIEPACNIYDDRANLEIQKKTNFVIDSFSST